MALPASEQHSLQQKLRRTKRAPAKNTKRAPWLSRGCPELGEEEGETEKVYPPAGACILLEIDCRGRCSLRAQWVAKPSTVT